MRVVATHSIRQFPLHFPSRASPCATMFRTSYTYIHTYVVLLSTFKAKSCFAIFVCLSVCSTVHSCEASYWLVVEQEYRIRYSDWAAGWTLADSNSRKSNRFCCPQPPPSQTVSAAHPASYLMDTGVISRV